MKNIGNYTNMTFSLTFVLRKIWYFRQLRKIQKIWYLRWTFFRKCCFSCSVVIYNCSTVMLFPLFEIWKNILWNWWVACFTARPIDWCDISGWSLWIHFLFYRVFFFSRKLCFIWSPCPLLIAESVSLDTSGKPTVDFFWKFLLPLG